MSDAILLEQLRDEIECAIEGLQNAKKATRLTRVRGAAVKGWLDYAEVSIRAARSGAGSRRSRTDGRAPAGAPGDRSGGSQFFLNFPLASHELRW